MIKINTYKNVFAIAKHLFVKFLVWLYYQPLRLCHCSGATNYFPDQTLGELPKLSSIGFDFLIKNELFLDDSTTNCACYCKEFTMAGGKVKAKVSEVYKKISKKSLYIPF